ncbi:PAS domain-containing sensor histidine kinase [Fulvivirga ulvae]|uniref:PAS domain-containing sensor histidine kinase n=1 Tax=Fulvivirga ulvae TaxID=2904245 RepID=UPI001F19A5E3|nr:PAS domain-containing sensor histidine kinase [Fulvivirga ulvae]UII32671.1 PAS domain-containing sensor histidine kinase [Fulvivirga ulvae]
MSSWRLNKVFFEHTSDTIAIANNRGKILYVNPSFERVSGYERAEIEGKPIDTIHSDETFSNAYWENVKELDESKNIFRKVFVNRKRNGNYFYLDTKIILYNSSAAKTRNYILIGTDITNVLEQTQRIGLLEVELQKSNQTLDTLLYKSSHDLRAPITTIQGLLNLARTDVNDDKLLNYLDMIVQSTSRLDSLLVDLRKLSWIHANRFSVQEINFEELVRSILEDLSRFIPVSEINIVVDVKVKKKHFYSKYLINRILRNLIDNACRYRYDRNTEKHMVVIGIEEVDSELHFFIQDNGRGIKEEAQERLFEMFYKAEAVSNRNGLGLHIARAAVEKLKGRIELSSAYNKGTKVKVTLP